MAHAEQRNYLLSLKEKHPEWFSGRRVLELGSFDVNGSVRDYFSDCLDYVGVDHRKGSLVDVVSLAHEFDPGGKTFDLLISCEMLEHDPYWRESIRNGVSFLDPGGVVIITAGGDNRDVHELACAPVTGYYKNISEAELTELLTELGIEFEISYDEKPRDIRAHGIKAI
jgi:hypothetical protein